MTVAPGTRLGPYEIVAPIGAGGMGEVFKARDTRLERSVAIKILPADFAANPQFRLRFEREAKTISQLNHPNICTLHDVGRDNGTDYLVMELIDGESLADRLTRGPLSMQETLKVGAQIADALDRAHRAGIVHRDLKPGNVMLTKSGVKLLDFGLAKAQPTAANASSVIATEHKPLTEEGTVVGTFQYMAPEQLEGEDADARTDIFALGTVLYEMATARRAFSGKTKTSLIAAIVSTDPPPISTIQPLTPPAFEHVVRKCLAKDRDDRWQSAHDVAEELRWIGEAGSQAGVAAPLAMKRKSRERLMWTALVVALAAVIAALALRRPRAEPVITASITPPLHAPFDFMTQAALSPDGNTIAFVARAGASRSLWIRRIDRGEAQALPATDGAEHPFWSPDSSSIGFFSEGKVKRIAIAGGPPQTICDAPAPIGGGTWNARGVIVMGSGGLGPLYRVNANGGPRQPLTKLGPLEEAHRWPFFLPDGEHFLFLGDASKTEDHHIKIGSLADGSSRDVMQGITNVQFVPPDKILFVRASTLLAQTLDVKSGSLTGEPRVVAERVVANDMNHHFEFTASPNGRLVYRSARSDAQLEWVDRNGKTIEPIGDPHPFDFWRIAPDQQRVAIATLDADGRPDDLWVVDRGRSITTRVTFDPAGDTGPMWSPDGSRIAFSSMRSGTGDLYVLDMSNPAAAQQLTKGGQIMPYAWTRDGSSILTENYKETDVDIGIYSMQSHELKPYLASQFHEVAPALSADNSWIAYGDDESGRLEIYIERFPTHAGRRQISTTGGDLPEWRRDGRELFFIGPGKVLMSVDPTADNATPKPLFTLPGNAYEASADGQRFIVDRPLDDRRKVPFTFVSNWR